MTVAALADSFWNVVRRVRGAVADDAAGPLARAPGGDVVVALRELDAIRHQCRRLVTRRATVSAGASVVPLPGLDLGTDVMILLRLLPQINERFGLSPEQIDRLDVETKRTVMLFVGSAGSALVGRLVTRELVVRLLMKMGVRVTTKGVVKFVPLLGQAVSASISFAAMKLLGNRHVDDCYEVARRTLLEQASTAQARGRSDWEVVP